jgi:hypothetical protein
MRVLSEDEGPSSVGNCRNRCGSYAAVAAFDATFVIIAAFGAALVVIAAFTVTPAMVG